MSIAEIGISSMPARSGARPLHQHEANEGGLRPPLPGVPYTCLVQGNGTNKELARIFNEDEHSVLFATKSFMTGVDFQGRLARWWSSTSFPSQSPPIPIVEARCELIEKRGGNTFADFTSPDDDPDPSAGVRSAHPPRSDDAGVVAILDRRLTTKGYGKKIVASLPDAPLRTTTRRGPSFLREGGI